MVKKSFYILLFLFLIFLVTPDVSASTFCTDSCAPENFCSSCNVLKTFTVAGLLINIVKIIIPLILIILGSIELGRCIFSSEADIKTHVLSLIKKIALGVAIFFIPTLITIIFNLLAGYSDSIKDYSACMDCFKNPNSCTPKDAITFCPSSDGIYDSNCLRTYGVVCAPKITAKQTTKVSDIFKRKSDTNINGGSGNEEGIYIAPSDDYPQESPSHGKFGSFPYNDYPEGREITIDPAWEEANITSLEISCGEYNQTITVNKAALNEFESAFNSICNLISEGKISAGDVNYGGAYYPRKTSSGGYSNHAWGTAMDLNYDWGIDVNGTTYYPYADQGESTYYDYQAFINDLGSEDDYRNVNYILWKYAFEPAGFEWGGTWDSGYFDPMHFEVAY